jgi:hypothetical protein
MPKPNAWHTRTGSAIRATFPSFASAVPVALVNATAFIGQFAYLREHVHWIVPGQVLIAVTIESIAVYLAWHAHLATMANDSSSRLKMGAYSFAALVGAMSYSHWAAPHWQPTFLAVLMFCMSAISPWLWGIYTRRASRDALMEQNLVEGHAVRLGATRWTWHPVRSFRVTWHATWVGETDPQRAIALLPVRRVRSGSARPGTLVPVQGEAVIPVQAGTGTVPVPAHAPLIGLPGGAATVGGSAHMSGAAGLRGTRPPHEVIEAAKVALAQMTDEQLPSIRAAAKDLLGDENQRRLARQLLAERRAAMHVGGSVPAFVRASRSSKPASMIAPPVGFAPGGATVNG